MLGVSEDIHGPKRLAARLARLGPLFVKIGQYLALRPDLLPQAYCDALLGLVDDAPAVPWEAIEAVLATELGAPPREVFASIRTAPLAAGSLAQVHLAETRDGRRVAVKVQRPGIAASVARSLRWARRAGPLIDRGLALPITSSELLNEIEAWLREELDFANELDNQLALRDAVRGLAGVRVALPLSELSTVRVLTAEYLEGMPFSQLLRLVRLGDAEVIARRGFDVELLAERLIHATYHQMFTARFFHADPHPGNLIAMPGNVVGLVDCGLSARLGPRLEVAQKDFLAALYDDDSVRLYRALASVVQPGRDSDMAAFRREFVAAADAWSDRRYAQAQPDGNSDTAGFMVTVMQLSRRHHVGVPPALLAVYRTLLTVEAVAQQLGAEADLGSVGRRFFAGSEVERLLGQFEPAQAMRWLGSLIELVRTGPPQLQELLTQLTEGQLVLTTQSRQSEIDRRAADRRAKLVALALVSLAPVLLLAADLGAGWTPWLLGALALLYGAMLILWWRLR